MVWEGVSLHHKTNIVFIKWNLAAARYQHGMLDTEVIPLLRNKQCNVVDFSPKSPDLNIIENIWDELNRRVRRTGTIPTALNQLRAKIIYEWNNLPQKYVQRYVTSMIRRCLNSAGDIPATKLTWTWAPLQDLTEKLL